MAVTSVDLRNATPTLYPDNTTGQIDAVDLRSGMYLIADIMDTTYSAADVAEAAARSDADAAEVIIRAAADVAEAAARSAADAAEATTRAEAVVRLDGKDSRLEAATGYRIPQIGAAADAVAKIQFGADGTSVAATSRNGTPITAASGRSWRVPTIYGLTAATLTLTGAMFSICGAGTNERAYWVPVIGQAIQARYSPAGEMIGGAGRFGALPRAAYVVPMIANLASGSWMVNGNAVAVVRDDAAVTQVGTLEQRIAAGSVTGRSLPQVYVRRSEASYTALTAGPYSAELISGGDGVATVKRRGITDTAKWRRVTVGDGATLHLILMVGQSLAQGTTDPDPGVNGAVDRYPVWCDPVHDRAYQFRAADGLQRGPRPMQIAPDGAYGVVITDEQVAQIEPMRGSDHAGRARYAQTALETMAAALLGQHLHHRDLVLGAVVGTGGTAIVNFSPASAHMASVDKIIVSANAIRNKMSGGGDIKALKVWLVWNQGEQDNVDGTLQASYVASWLAIRDHISAAAVAAGGTFGGSVIQQCENRYASSTGMATLAHAQLIRAGAAMGVPHYPMLPGHSGAAHLFPATYLPLGSACAYAISEAMDGTPYVAPHVADGNALLAGPTVIDCAFSAVVGAMQFDTATIPDRADGWKGVVVQDDIGVKTIVSLAWVGSTSLRITTAENMLLTDHPIVRFGLDGTGNSLLPNPDGPRVNMRDGSNWPCIATGQPISGWVIQHQVTVA